MPIERDLVLMPQPDNLADLPDARPKGLLDQLLEDGSVYREFVMSGTTFQVKTTARFESKDVCFFRSAVSREDSELTEAPWAPIFCNLTEGVTAGEVGAEARLAFARRALEVHLSLCHRVERQLEEKGVLSTPSILQTRVPWPYAAAILLLVVAAGAWYGYERWLVRLPGPPVSLLPAASPSTIASPVEMAVDPLVAEDVSDPTSQTHAEPASDSTPRSPAAAGRVNRAAASPARRPPEARRKSEPSEQPRRIARSRPTEPQPESPPPPALAPAATAPSAPPPSPAPATRAGTVLPSLITEVVPGNHRLLHLEPGANVYADANIRISGIPQAYRQLPCVTTASRQGGTEQGLFLQLKRAARVFVAHDLRVKKKPEWLASFRATGDTLWALEVDKGKTLEFAIFRRDVSAGAVTLGSNTRTKALTRKVREFVPRKNRVMYLVCVAEADGQVPSSRRNP